MVAMEDIFNRPYYRVNTTMLKLMGLWPLQSRTKNLILRTITFTLLSSIIAPKLIKLLESLNDFDMVVECIPMVGLHFGSVINFVNMSMHENNLRQMLRTMERDWKSLLFERDVGLLTHYSNVGRKMNVFYACALYGILALYLASPAIPKILDFLLPLNETRSRIVLYQTEYFVDQEKYYLQILLHAYFTVPLSLALIVFFDNQFGTFVYHSCGMIEILKWHLENLTDEKTTEIHGNLFEQIKFCANLQTNIIHFMDKIESSYSLSLLLMSLINISLITLTGVVTILKIDQASEVIRNLMFHVGTLFHLFWTSWQGHVVMVQSESIFRSAYQSKWYNAPCMLQRMLLPMMMRSLEPSQLTAGKLYVLSMNSFGATIRMNLSMLTLLLSFQ